MRALLLIPLLFLTVFKLAAWWIESERERVRVEMRRETVAKTRLMLADVIRNQLTVIAMNAQMIPDVDPHRMARIEGAIEHITKAINALSDVSLAEWEEKYKETVQTTLKLQQELRES